MNQRLPRNIAIGAAVLMALAPLHARAEDKCKNAYESGYQAGKDVAALRREVKDLRALVSQLLERLGENPELAKAPANSERITPEAPPPSSNKQASLGTITGKVSFPSSSKVAYVYIDNVRGRMARGRKATVSQSRKQFSPRWLVVQKGTTVSFPNQDNIYHNVFSKSPLASFDLGIYRSGDKAKTYTFTKPGVVNVYCNMHEKMNAEVLVVPNYLYTRVAADGSFNLKRVPVGKRKLVAWAPGAKLSTTWINVKGGTNRAKLQLKSAGKRSHKNKHGQPYGSYP